MMLLFFAPDRMLINSQSDLITQELDAFSDT